MSEHAIVRVAIVFAIAIGLAQPLHAQCSGFDVDHIIWAAETPAAIDSVAAVASALDTLGETYVIIDDLYATMSCITPEHTLWCMTGTFPSAHYLAIEEGTFLRNHVLAGGNVYFEGTDVFGFEPPTPFAEVDGIDWSQSLDGDDSFVAMLGSAHGMLDVSDLSDIYMQDQAGSDYTNRLVPSSSGVAGVSAGVIWRDATQDYGTGVFYDTDPGFGKVIYQSWEFGGFGGSQVALATRYIGAFTVTCPGVADVDCMANCATGEVLLSWTNPASYTSIEVERDGTLIDTLPGTAVSYVDAPGDGTYAYRLRAMCGADVAASSPCSTLVTSEDIPDHLIWAAEDPSGLTDSVLALATQMDDAGMTYAIIDDVLELSCPQGRTLWAMTGTYPSNHPLTAADGSAMVDWIQAGGNLFFEGNDAWGYDPGSEFWDYDGIDESAVWDGDDSLHSLIGDDYHAAMMSGFGTALYAQDRFYGPEFTDHLVLSASDHAGPNSGVIWRQEGVGYATGVYYDTDPGFGKVLAQSWEFGGYMGDQAALLNAIVSAFGASTTEPVFRRGDANADGTFDVADAVFTLGALFVSGSPAPACQDAADANDDGAVDISDPIVVLNALFAPGAPVPPAPGVLECGPDPTSDTLDCVGYSSCP